MNEQAPTPTDLAQQIITRALKDPKFRDELIATPREALASMGTHLPEDVQIRVVEQEANSLYRVLPMRPSALDAEDELSEAELAYVDGGGGYAGSGLCQ